MGGAAGASARAIGGFAGRKPCDPPILAPTPVDPVCRTVLGACALGVGWVDPPDVDTVPDVAVTTACVVDKSLVLDVDRDGTPESFPLDALLGQDAEVTGGPKGGICAKPFFAGRLSDRVDLIAVADLDADGRMEIVLGTQTRWFLYTARQSASRLDRVATLDLSASSRP